MAGLLRPLMQPVRYDLEEDEKRAPTVITEAAPAAATFAGSPGAVGATPQPVDYSTGSSGGGLLGGTTTGTVPTQGGGGLLGGLGGLTLASVGSSLFGGSGVLGSTGKALGKLLPADFTGIIPFGGSFGLPSGLPTGIFGAPAAGPGLGGLLTGLGGIAGVVGGGLALRSRGKARRARREKQRAEKIGKILQGDQDVYNEMIRRTGTSGEPGVVHPYMLAYVANKYYGPAANSFVSDMAERYGMPAGTTFDQFAAQRDFDLREEQRRREQDIAGP